MNRFFFISIYLSLLFLPKYLSGGTIHAVLVIDTINDISHITNSDLNNVQSELTTITGHTQMILKEKTFVGSEFNREKVWSYLKELKVESDDVIFFYFSGHGYRTHQKKSKLPLITFELFKQGIDLKDIADEIRGKKARFSLVMADCCNNFLERGFRNQQKNVVVNLHHTTPNQQGLQKLFLQAKGCIVISSSSAGEFSYGSRYGGLYTQCFLASLKRETCQSNPSWATLLKRAYGYIARIQKPIYEVYN
jgi:hypothetical protein